MFDRARSSRSRQFPHLGSRLRNRPRHPRHVGGLPPALALGLALFALATSFAPANAKPAGLAAGDRLVTSLNGPWEFQTNGAPADSWKTVTVPSDFESHEGTNFNGVGWYRLSWPAAPVPTGCRVLLEFEAAATEAEVWVNGQRLGSHLGGWTPFRFDITDVLAAHTQASNRLQVRLDEKVGHNTQGFLPIIQPHFGGLWQGVSLRTVPGTYIDDLRLRAAGNPDTGDLELEVPVAGTAPESVDALLVRHRPRGTGRWIETRIEASFSDPGSVGPPGVDAGTSRPGRPTLRREGQVLHAKLPVDSPRWWSPGDPQLYEVEVRLPAAPGGLADRVKARAAFRKIEAVGRQLRLNGHPLSVRGLLNWGYYPPHLAPRSDPAAFRRDIEFARDRGFNLMKFCLWVPPRTFLELCDDLGMLTWIEYPTWHPQLTPQYLGPLRQEFTEFFAYDRNHPSAILRSLTCETGPGADLGVIRSLYDLAHAMIPGAVIEDDSSWIEWNRVSDIYDDHPYGNNHTWVPTLARLKAYIRTNDPKPLVLGEAIAADTWVPRDQVLGKIGDTRPYWVPPVLDRQPAWLDRMAAVAGPGGLDRLVPESLRYAHAMRKYQVEAYRREVPDGGYVVSVIRDVPVASMGLRDYLGAPKWTARDWAWHGETMCLLATPDDARSVAAGGKFRGQVLVSHFGTAPLTDAELTVIVSSPDLSGWPAQILRRPGLTLGTGDVAKLLDLDVAMPETGQPARLTVRANLRAGRANYRNEWTLWLLPRATVPSGLAFRCHPSIRTDAPIVPRTSQGTDPETVWVTARLDDATASFLEQGGKVLLLPDGEPGSFRLASHWFLRGAPYLPDHDLLDRVPRDLLVDLQHFDLAGDVLPDLVFLEEIDPILMLWDTHDHQTVKTHGLVFETRVGAGRLMVSALRHGGANNPVGAWLLTEFLRHLDAGPPPRNALSPALWTGFKARLHADRVPLNERKWRFHPDPDVVGVDRGWASADLDDTAWAEIEVGQHWESQGYAALDKWAWYRLRVEVPERWQGRPVYLTFEGVDDCYELFVDGKLVARRGDPVARKDTFNEKFSHDLSTVLKPGTSAVIAVRVYDWYGAGGIFRPVTLATVPHDPRTEALR